MSREWTNIDVLRMEKFLLLVRRYLCAMFGLMRDVKWSGEVVAEQLALLEEIPLNVEDLKIGNGIRYHVIDIYVDEVERIGALREDEKDRVPLETLLGPLRRIAKGSPTKDVRRKAKEALEDERLPGNEKAEVPEEQPAEGEWGGIED